MYGTTVEELHDFLKERGYNQVCGQIKHAMGLAAEISLFEKEKEERKEAGIDEQPAADEV